MNTKELVELLGIVELVRRYEHDDGVLPSTMGSIVAAMDLVKTAGKASDLASYVDKEEIVAEYRIITTHQMDRREREAHLSRVIRAIVRYNGNDTNTATEEEEEGYW
jgi:hypothetical protein